MLVVAATPITSVFLIAKALHFTDTVTASVLSATFLMCGLGAILQSTGVKGVGARLPFIMVPGRADCDFRCDRFTDQYPDRDWRRNSDLAVLLYRVADFPPLPAPFSPFIIGIMLLMVSINLIRLYGGLIIGQPGAPTSLIQPVSFYRWGLS